MSRPFCYQCRRAKVACLCGRIEKQPNSINVIVLQHPEESANPKGSAIIAELGLQLYQRWVGEDFSQHKELNRLLSEQRGEVAILYPAEKAVILSEAPSKTEHLPNYLVIIDASWRKASKIWLLNTFLHNLPALTFSTEVKSDYRIRKVPQDGYLSTVESIVVALRLLENNPQGYQPLLGLFTEMIDFQIEQMGQSTYEGNYQGK